MKDNGGEHRHCWHWGGVELYEGFALIILYSKPLPMCQPSYIHIHIHIHIYTVDQLIRMTLDYMLTLWIWFDFICMLLYDSNYKFLMEDLHSYSIRLISLLNWILSKRYTTARFESHRLIFCYYLRIRSKESLYIPIYFVVNGEIKRSCLTLATILHIHEQ
jgi:hypothetical protein